MEREPKIWFLTFGGGSVNYHSAVDRICKQADDFELFERIIGYKCKDLPKIFPEFWEREKEFIKSHPRGYGYWIWRPLLILDTFEKMNDGDILLFADAGCELNVYGKNRMLEYIDMTKNHGCLFFQIEHPDYKWTKADCIDVIGLDLDSSIVNSDQIEGGSFFLKKTERNITLIKKVSEIANLDCHHYITDERSRIPNHPEFIEHRHDQSILSLLVKKGEFNYLSSEYSIKGERYFAPDWNRGKKFPILTMRTRHGTSQMPWNGDC